MWESHAAARRSCHVVDTRGKSSLLDPSDNLLLLLHPVCASQTLSSVCMRIELGL